MERSEISVGGCGCGGIKDATAVTQGVVLMMTASLMQGRRGASACQEGSSSTTLQARGKNLHKRGRGSVGSDQCGRASAGVRHLQSYTHWSLQMLHGGQRCWRSNPVRPDKTEIRVESNSALRLRSLQWVSTRCQKLIASERRKSETELYSQLASCLSFALPCSALLFRSCLSRNVQVLDSKSVLPMSSPRLGGFRLSSLRTAFETLSRLGRRISVLDVTRVVPIVVSRLSSKQLILLYV